MKPPSPEHGLEALEFLSDLEPAARARLAGEFETLALKRGEVLVRQGEPADALYVVVSGRFLVTLDGRPAPLAEIGAGQPIGEIAFLAGGRRTATVRAMRDSLVLRFRRADFDRLCTECPSVWRSLTVTLARRIAHDNSAAPAAPDPRPRTIVIVRAGGGAMPDGFVPMFAEVFREAVRTRFVTPTEVREVLAAGTSLESPVATRTLNALESGHDYVVFVADPEPSAWSEKAIRQADLVLAVARHGSDPTPNAVERLAAAFLPREARRLVLVHDRRGVVRGTGRWLEGRDIAMHHHVTLNAKSDFERLYRFISGTARGLVACGGGAFCAAHVGVYKALGERGVVLDIMGGTSAGSALAAAFALGAAPEAIDRAIDDIFVANRSFRRYTLPRYSLVDHTHFDRHLVRHFGEIDIEDLWIPYFAVSTNLSTYDLHRHRRGPLWAAIRASAAIPVLLPPYYTRDGHMLVDGCLLDNVPIRVMHEIKSGPNVVVSFRVPDLERFEVDYDTLPSRAALLSLLANPLRYKELPRAPGLHTVLLRSLMANRQDFKRHLTREDVVLVPPVPADMGLLDWHRHTELMETACSWAREELTRLGEQHPSFPMLAGTAP
jgi:NTE family protein